MFWETTLMKRLREWQQAPSNLTYFPNSVSPALTERVGALYARLKEQDGYHEDQAG
jgi:hypothetical protein